MTEVAARRLAAVALWTGRALSLVLALFWGAFFVEHLGEWFLRPQAASPPPFVWVGQALHGAMIAGLLLMVRWDKWGTVVMVVATVAFFSVIGMNRFPWIAFLNAVPLPFLAIFWWLSPKRA